MSEAGPISGPERARRPDVRRSSAAAAVEDAAMCRLGGAVHLLDDLAAHLTLTPDEYRWYFAAWQASRVLVPRPQHAAGQVSARRPSASRPDDRGHLDSTTVARWGGGPEE